MWWQYILLVVFPCTQQILTVKCLIRNRLWWITAVDLTFLTANLQKVQMFSLSLSFFLFSSFGFQLINGKLLAHRFIHPLVFRIWISRPTTKARNRMKKIELLVCCEITVLGYWTRCHIAFWKHGPVSSVQVDFRFWADSLPMLMTISDRHLWTSAIWNSFGFILCFVYSIWL